VGIGELEFFDRPRHLDHLVAVEAGPGMMLGVPRTLKRALYAACRFP
jgi:hypothetical protein